MTNRIAKGAVEKMTAAKPFKIIPSFHWFPKRAPRIARGPRSVPRRICGYISVVVTFESAYFLINL
jgi:hypothetical protein